MNPSCDFISRDPYDPNAFAGLRKDAAIFLANKPLVGTPSFMGRYKHAGDYIRYKKMQAIAGSLSGPRPSQTNTIVAALQAACATP